MTHRFRYLDEQGQQVEVADLSDLRRHVREGSLDRETLLYDGLTDQWAPAASHSAYRLLDDPLTKGPDGDGGSEGTDATSGDDGGSEHSEPGFDFPDLDVTLAPADEAESTDEVVKKLLRERERDRGLERDPAVTRGYVPPSSDSPAAEAPAESADPPQEAAARGPRRTDPLSEPGRSLRPRPDRTTATRSQRMASNRAARREAERRMEGRRRTGRLRRTGGPRERAPASAGGPARWRRVEVPGWAVALGAVALVGVGVYGAVRAVNGPGAAEASAGELDAADVPARPANGAAWTVAEGGAFQDMLEGVDSLRGGHSVERIPRTWLTGPYLADAEDFPEVREYWTNYLHFVDAVRHQDTALFRRSFVSRLEEQGVSGSVVSMRLAQALETFGASQPARDTVYVRMEDLAMTSLDLHDLLVERSGELVHDPVTEERASRLPILEAWSDDPFLRQSIWSLLDRITANLALLKSDVDAGRSDLTERLFQELRARSTGTPTAKSTR